MYIGITSTHHFTYLKNKFLKRIYIYFCVAQLFLCYLQSALKEIIHAFVRISFEGRYDFYLSVISHFRTFLRRCESTPAQLRTRKQLFCLFIPVLKCLEPGYQKKYCELSFIFPVETHIGAWFSYQPFFFYMGNFIGYVKHVG